MTAVDPRRVVLELLPGPGPIAGAVRAGEGPKQAFRGWLELCALLDRARAASGEPDR
jgi:hypothetical protein